MRDNMRDNLASGKFRSIKDLATVGISSLLNSFLNQGCAVCDRPTSRPFCPDCQRQLQSQISSDRQLTKTAISQMATLGNYDGSLKRAILALKYENRPQVAQFLGSELGRYWSAVAKPSKDKLYALPIPLHQGRRQQRGYNQAALLARSFCQASGLALLEHGLGRSRATLPQHQLGLAARQQNLAGVFELSKSLTRLRQKGPLGVVVIDDIYTTGATVQSAADALNKANIPVVGVAAVAQARAN